jgi:hypothetical protein
VLARLRRQDGQIIPALMVLMLALLAVGVMFFQVGRAAIFSTEAQTAADAAALGAAEEVKAQLLQQMALTGTANPALVDPIRVRLKAELYAQKNKGHVVKLERRGVDIKVWAKTNAKLGSEADEIDREDARGAAHARARLDVTALPGVGSIGQIGGSLIKNIGSKLWNELGDEIDGKPSCGSGKGTNDLIKLGEMLREHGFQVGENAEMGDNPAPGVHSGGGFHYQCRNSGALDVNADSGPGSERQLIDGIVGDVQELGFRTIWQAPGHFDHIHIDLGLSGAIGVGGGLAGGIGPLEEAGLEVKLIDWESTYTPFGGFGGLASGGTYGGPPDPAVARALCGALDRANASPKIRLATFETAIVESGVHNLNYGDRDSIGVFQQRPSQGWGVGYSIMDPAGAAGEFIRRAKINSARNPGYSAGQLSQSVQISAFPERYDQVALQAYALMETYCT